MTYIIALQSFSECRDVVSTTLVLVDEECQLLKAEQCFLHGLVVAVRDRGVLHEICQQQDVARNALHGDDEVVVESLALEHGNQLQELEEGREHGLGVDELELELGHVLVVLNVGRVRGKELIVQLCNIQGQLVRTALSHEQHRSLPAARIRRRWSDPRAT